MASPLSPLDQSIAMTYSLCCDEPIFELDFSATVGDETTSHKLLLKVLKIKKYTPWFIRHQEVYPLVYQESVA